MKTIRPDWYKLLTRTAGAYVACTCGQILQTQEQLREHYQRGHFDTYKDDEEVKT